jgi:peptidoglycan/xylan/chitin deacetylase (PgdA/CDA1 family)
MTVAIFLLHRIAPRINDPWELSVEPAEFEGFVEALVASGALVDLPQALADHAEDPRRVRCVLTFDDGYDDLRRYAFPVLRLLRARTALFLPTRYVADGAPFWWEALTWLGQQPDHLRRVEAAWGWETKANAAATVDAWCGRLKRLPPEIRDPMIDAIGLPPGLPRAIAIADLADIPETVQVECHGHSHTVLTALTDHQVEEEVRLCCDYLAAWTGRRPRIFAYPNGQPDDFTSVHADVLRGAGFTHALTTVSEVIRSRPDPCALPRICVKPGRALRQLEEVLAK